MDRIKGRISDVIRLPSRKIVAGEYLTTIFDDHPEAVKEFQICQEEDYSIHLFCVLGIAPNSIAICNQKIEDLRRLVSNEVNVVLFIVESISHHEGKTRFIVSKLK